MAINILDTLSPEERERFAEHIGEYRTRAAQIKEASSAGKKAARDLEASLRELNDLVSQMVAERHELLQGIISMYETMCVAYERAAATELRLNPPVNDHKM